MKYLKLMYNFFIQPRFLYEKFETDIKKIHIHSNGNNYHRYGVGMEIA